MPKNNCKKINTENVPNFDSACDKNLSLLMPENFMAELNEARFISSFMASVSSSLEIDAICSIAARALYKYAPYNRIVFAFSAEFAERNVIFSPMIQKGIFTASPKTKTNRPCVCSNSNENSLVSINLNLLENMGTISIDFKGRQAKNLSESLLSSVVAYFSQAVKNAHEHGKMKDLAMHDDLTKLLNRRIFDETLAQKIKNPGMCPVSILLIDLDNFKRVNDTYGHQAGDQVLMTFARILKDSCRGQDIVARFGGEEFAIILSQTQTTTAHTIAQRIRNRLVKTVFTFDNRQFHVTASIGLATCLEGSTNIISSLIKLADQALYQAKRTGKNKVCVLPINSLHELTLSCGTKKYGSMVHASC